MILNSDKNKECKQDVFLAVCRTKNKLLKKLLKKKINVNCQNKNTDTMLMLASKKCYYDCVKIIIGTGAKINVVNKQGDTALHLAAGKKRNEKVIEYLISKGAYINKKNSLGMTPLMIASSNGHKSNLIALLRHQPCLNVRTLNDETALTFAIVWRHKDIVKLLVQSGADINKKDSFGWRPLNYALQEGQREIIDTLIKNGASVGIPAKKLRKIK